MEVAREFQKSDVFFADVIKDADGAAFSIREADDLAAGAAELALQGLNTLRGETEVVLEELLNSVHENAAESASAPVPIHSLASRCRIKIHHDRTWLGCSQSWRYPIRGWQETLNLGHTKGQGVMVFGKTSFTWLAGLESLSDFSLWKRG